MIRSALLKGLSKPKLALSIISFLCLLSCSITPVELNIAPVWEIGKPEWVTMLTFSYSVANGDTTRTSQVLTRCNLLPVGKNKFKWTYASRYFEGVSLQDVDPSVRGDLESIEGLEVLFETDDSGKFKTVLNLDDITKFINKAIDTLGKVRNDSDSITFSRKLIALRPQEIEKAVLSDIRFFMDLYGTSLVFKKMVIQASEVSFEGFQIPCRDSLLFVDFDNDLQRGRIMRVRSTEPGKARKLLQERLNERRLFSEKIKLSDIKEFDFTHESQYIYDKRRSLVIRADARKTVETAGAKHVLITTIYFEQ